MKSRSKLMITGCLKLVNGLQCTFSKIYLSKWCIKEENHEKAIHNFQYLKIIQFHKIIRGLKVSERPPDVYFSVKLPDLMYPPAGFQI